MMQALLINKNDFIPYADINSNIVTAKKLDPFIYQAQFIDLKATFGQEFYYDIIEDFLASPSLIKYSDLLNGSTYIKSGHTYTHEGLKPVLCYFAHSRYVMGQQSSDTAYGQVVKNNDYSTPSPEKLISRLADTSRSLAYAYMLPVVKFLDDHIADFPLWKPTCYESFYRHYGQYYPNQIFNHVGYSRIKKSTKISRIG